MDVSLDGSTDGFAGRMEILEDRSGRRFRSEGERARIAAESLVPGVRVADVARRHEVTRWHRSLTPVAYMMPIQQGITMPYRHGQNHPCT